MQLLKLFYWRRQWHPTPVLLPGKSHGRRSLVGCSAWGCWGLDMTEQLHFSLSCIGEGNGNPLQCSCLENPRDGRAWWAAVYGVTQRHNWSDLAAAEEGTGSHFPKYCFNPFDTNTWPEPTLIDAKLFTIIMYLFYHEYF